jgi:hypothetical protein
MVSITSTAAQILILTILSIVYSRPTENERVELWHKNSQWLVLGLGLGFGAMA